MFANRLAGINFFHDKIYIIYIQNIQIYIQLGSIPPRFTFGAHLKHINLLINHRPLCHFFLLFFCRKHLTGKRFHRFTFLSALQHELNDGSGSIFPSRITFNSALLPPSATPEKDVFHVF